MTILNGLDKSGYSVCLILTNEIHCRRRLFNEYQCLVRMFLFPFGFACRCSSRSLIFHIGCWSGGLRAPLPTNFDEICTKKVDLNRWRPKDDVSLSHFADSWRCFVAGLGKVCYCFRTSSALFRSNLRYGSNRRQQFSNRQNYRSGNAQKMSFIQGFYLVSNWAWLNHF